MKKIVAALTDLSFKRFVTPQLASLIYVIAVIFAVVACLPLFRMGAIGFILAPITLITAILFTRCALELVLAVFQIARYTAEIARRGRPAGALEGEGKEVEDRIFGES